MFEDILEEREDVSYAEVYETFLVCSKSNKAKSGYYSFNDNISENLLNIYNDLNNRTYKIGKCTAFIKKKNNKREIFAFSFRDRIVCKLISNRIEKLLDDSFIDDNYAGRKCKGVSYALNKCREYIEECSNDYKDEAYIFKADLKSYFLSINKHILLDKLSDFLRKKSNWSENELDFNLWLIETIVFYEPQKNCVINGSLSDWSGIPDDKLLFNSLKDIGVACGNILIMWLSLFYLDDFDRFVKEELGYKYYGRYMDDFYIVTKDKEKLLGDIKRINEKLNDVGTTLHPHKTYMQEVKKGVEFVGCVIKPHRTFLARKTVKLIWKACYELGEALKCRGRQNMEVIRHCICVLNSYLGLMKGKNTYKLRKKVIGCDSLKKLWEYCEYNEECEKVTLKKKYKMGLK